MIKLTLHGMGFEPKHIHKLFIYNHVRDLDHALELMLPGEDGRYVHDFIPGPPPKTDKCAICKTNMGDHRVVHDMMLARQLNNTGVFR